MITPTEAKALAEKRAAFEEMMRRDYPLFPLKAIETVSGEILHYASSGTQHMWNGWLAARVVPSEMLWMGERVQHEFDGWQAARRQHGSAAQAVAGTDLQSWPERIYLQHSFEYVPNFDVAYRSCGEITWCQDSIERYDIAYVRADLAALAAPPADAERVKGKTAAQWYVAYCEKSEQLKAADGAINRYAQRVTELEATLSRRPAAAAEPSDGEIYQAVSERHATPELRAAVAEEMAEIAAAVRAEVAAEQPAALTDEQRDELVALRFDGAKWRPCARDHEDAMYCAADVHKFIEQHLRAAGQGKDSERLNLLLNISGFHFEIIDQQFYLLNGRGRIAGKGDTKRAAIDAAMKAGAHGAGK